MALTERERRWLEWRKNPCNRCGRYRRCGWTTENIPCEKRGLFEVKAWGTKDGCVKKDFRDAVEFEARVAARLSSLVYAEPWPNLWPECISCQRHAKEGDAACPPCVLKESRLAVESEMEQEEIR